MFRKEVLCINQDFPGIESKAIWMGPKEVNAKVEKEARAGNHKCRQSY
jgi:hypothetical protein